MPWGSLLPWAVAEDRRKLGRVAGSGECQSSPVPAGKMPKCVDCGRPVRSSMGDARSVGRIRRCLDCHDIEREKQVAAAVARRKARAEGLADGPETVDAWEPTRA